MRKSSGWAALLAAGVAVLILTPPVESAVFYVGNRTEFQQALNTARTNSENDTIWVTNHISVNSTLNFQPSAAEDNHGLTIRGSVKGNPARLTYTGGEQIMNINTTAHAAHGNIYIENLKFEDADSAGFGGGLYIVARGSSVMLEKLTFTNCAAPAGGGAYLEVEGDGKFIRVSRCRFTGNRATGNQGGGGIEITAAGPETGIYFYNNILTGNTCAGTEDFKGGGGAFLYMISGGGINNRGRISCVNNTFTGNSAAGDGGGLYINTGDSPSANTQIYNNIARSNTCGAARLGSDIYVHNRGATPRQYIYFYNNNRGWSEFRYMDNVYFGGNINQDPLLDAGYFLQAGSPCIDTGRNDKAAEDPNSLPSIADDFSGGARRVYGGSYGSPAAPIVDIGADEYDPPPPTRTPAPARTRTPAPARTPTPAGPRAAWIIDFNGDGTSDIAIFRRTSGLWAVRGITRAYFGGINDYPAPGDYNGNGTTEIGIFRPASGLWAARGATRVYFGGGLDMHHPGDYDGDGTWEPAIFRAASGLWAVRGVTRAYFGGTADIPAPGYYRGDGSKSIGIFRPASGLWAVRGLTRVYFGSAADIPVPGDYSGDGSWVPAIFREFTGLSAVRGVTRAYFGASGDMPLPAVYSGGGADQIGLFRFSSGLWAIKGVTRAYFGAQGDSAVTR